LGISTALNALNDLGNRRSPRV